MHTLPALSLPFNRVRGELFDSILARHVRSIERASFCDVCFPGPEHEVLRAADGIHPTAVGYAEWGRQMSKHILETGPHYRTPVCAQQMFA
jgi:lysophospholipase L1-like esterase